MDYEKKYKEALEKARKFYNELAACRTKQKVAAIFPELRESEDERIRKWIKKEIEDKYVVEGIVSSKRADEAFGWLEKQKHLYETTKDRFYREGFEEGQLYERQKEQKPAEWNEEDEELAEELIKLAEYYTDTEDTTEFKPHISWLKALPERFNLQPKQEWSEEDNRILKGIITVIESRLSEIIGDAQPAPVLRAELQDLIKRIKEEV